MENIFSLIQNGRTHKGLNASLVTHSTGCWRIFPSGGRPSKSLCYTTRSSGRTAGI
jgi:hypothetical protein